MKKKYLIVIGGPTAIGKTTTAIQIATIFNLEILSADSRQFYKEMSIGTAKPTEEELNQAPHHFINSLSITTPFTVGDYEQLAIKKLKILYEKYEAAILVGGSGMFIRAVCEGLDTFPAVPDAIRQKWINLFESKGVLYLQQLLNQQDPDYFSEVDIQNPQRLIRALSVIDVSGLPFSAFRQKKIKARSFQPIYILLEAERAFLYDRINHRVDEMIKDGLIEEAKMLYPKRQHNALQTVGYKELFQYFDGQYSLEEAIRLIKRNSRRYAKRQMTWFRKRAFWTPFPHTNIEDIQRHIQRFIDSPN